MQTKRKANRRRSSFLPHRGRLVNLPLDRRLRLEPLEDRRMLAITVDSLVDEVDGSIVDGDVSLRDAIASAMSDETIDFDASLDGGTILLDLANGDIDIDVALTIDASSLASGITIDAGNGVDGVFGTSDGIRIFNINDGNGGIWIDVTLRGMMLTGGDVSGDGGAIFSTEILTIANSSIEANFSGANALGTSNSGGGIYSEGTLTVEDSFITANATSDGAIGFGGSPGSPGLSGGGSLGGGVFATGTLTISGSTLIGNSTGDGGRGGQGGAGASGGGGGTSAGGGVYATGPTTIHDSEFIGNRVSDGGPGGIGGGIFVSSGSQGSSQGGGLYATDTMAITDSVFRQNSTATGTSSQGGAVYTTGGTEITSSTISENQTDDAFSTYGGGIFASASLSIGGTTVSNNHTGNANNGSSGNLLNGGPGGVGGSSLGGGIYAGGGLSVETSTIADNSVGNGGVGGIGTGDNDGGNGGNSNGGGIYAAGMLTVTAGTISGNTTGDGGSGGVGGTNGASGRGGGGGIASFGGFLIESSTISGNETGNGTLNVGGGMWAMSPVFGNPAILYSTIADNTANGVGGGVQIFLNATTILTVEHSIVAGNTDITGNTADFHYSVNPFTGAPNPQFAYSVLGELEGLADFNNLGGNIFLGALGDPMLGPLADNGGPTQTHALLPGSPAIDAGDPTIVAGGLSIPFDPYQESFNTSAADVTINVSTSGDTSITFVDYSDFTVGATDFSLFEAPGRVAGSASTRGILLQANVSSALESAINVLAGATPISFSGDYRVTFDAYLNVDVPIPGTGTEQLLWGVGTNNDGSPESRTSADNAIGTWGWLATENGYALNDATIYEDGVLQSELNGGGPTYDNTFTNEIGGSFTESAPAKQWVTVVVEVLNGVATVSYDGNASSTPVEFFNAASSVTSGFAMFGYEDPFSSISGSPDFQWGLFDNFRVKEIFNRARTDQRGTPYVGVVDGDSDTMAAIDIGAFEVQQAAADYDIDDDVDGIDFLLWQRGFGTPMPNVTKSDGDADNDLDVDGDDLDIWETQFGSSSGLLAASSIAVDYGPVLATAESMAQPSRVTAELIGAALAMTLPEQSPANAFSEFISEGDNLQLVTRAAAVLDLIVDTPSVNSSASIAPSANRSNTAKDPEETKFALAAVDEVFQTYLDQML